MAIGKTKGNCYNYGSDNCQARPDLMTDFETYLIKRIDDLEGQLTGRITDVDKKVTVL